MSCEQEKIISGKQLASNVLWNVIGAGAPLLAALFSIPLLISGLGTERFGVLMIAWMVVGYFSLFDLGIGRAITKLVADKLGSGQRNEIAPLVWTAMWLMLILGVFGALIISMISPWLVVDVLTIPFELQSETLNSFYLLAISIPVVISSIGLRGILEAYQRFDLVNVVRIPLGIINFIGPVMILPFFNSLAPVVGVLVVSRVLSWLAYAFISLKVEPSLRGSFGMQSAIIKPLIRFGGWLTVTNVIGPLMVYMDRFIIGAMVSMTAVAFYATPYEMVTKLWIIPGALMGVMFPAFSTLFVQDKPRALRLFNRSVNYIFLSLFPIVLIVTTLSSEGLTLWLGSEFSKNSSLVLQLLAVGVFINSLAHAPFGLIQGVGRPDLTAKLHLIELPFYLLSLWWLLDGYGIIGAAVAWVLRVSVDAICLFIMVDKLVSLDVKFFRRLLIMVGVALLMIVFVALTPDIVMKLIFLLMTLFIFSLIAWLVILKTDEKDLMRGGLKKLFLSKN